MHLEGKALSIQCSHSHGHSVLSASTVCGPGTSTSTSAVPIAFGIFSTMADPKSKEQQKLQFLLLGIAS